MNVIFAAIMSQSMVTQLAIFGSVAAVAWWLLDTFSRRKPRAVERLDEFREPSSRKGDVLSNMKSSKGAMAKVLERASPALSAPLKPKTDADFNKTGRSKRSDSLPVSCLAAACWGSPAALTSTR
jgi:hypothetical protein